MSDLHSTNKPFVVISPYQMEGDVAFGVWDANEGVYVLGDGDWMSLEMLEESWPNAKLLTWSELETLLGAKRL